MAKETKAVVHLLHAAELPAMPAYVVRPEVASEASLIRELDQEVEKKFKELCDQKKTEGVKVVTKLEYGTTSKTILEYIGDENIDLVVMGSHGASGLKEIFIGSNAEKIVRSSPVPVLVVKNYFNGNVNNIIFPNTLETEHQEDLVMKVKSLQDLFHAKLHIVYINTPFNFTSDVVTLERLQAFASRFMIKDYTINVFNHQDEEEGINLFARKMNAELIAMGTHGRKGIAHLVNGSLAENVTNHADSLVWTYTLMNKPVEV